MRMKKSQDRCLANYSTFPRLPLFDSVFRVPDSDRDFIARSFRTMNFSRLTALAILLVSCNDTTQKFDQQSLDTKRQSMVSFINTAQCTKPKGCRSIAVGSKPCGGASEYFIYSTTLDTAKLIQMAEAYSMEMSSFNIKWKVISDCSVVSPPDSTRCVSGICNGYWNGVARRQQ